MNSIRIIIINIFLFITLHAQNIDTVLTDIGNITIEFYSNGSIGLIDFQKNNLIYSAGFYVSGYTNNELWSNGVFPSNGDQDYIPGNTNTSINDSSNIIYEIRSTDSAFGESWQKWKEAVKKGAEFYDGNKDGIYNPVDLNGNGLWDLTEDKPDLLGDYTAWTVYNDGVPENERNFENPSAPQGIEIRQTLFAFSGDTNSVLSNTVFLRYTIENKNSFTDTLKSVYFGIIMDPDIGEYSNDFTGCDTILSSFYGYDKLEDGVFGLTSPATIATFLQGPPVYSSGDTAIIKEGKLRGTKTIANAKLLRMTSSSSALRGTSPLPPPQSTEHARFFLEGGKYPNGDTINISTFQFGNGDSLGNISDSISAKFMFSGDPVKNTGWLNTFPSDWRVGGATGPFQLIKNNPVEIIVAYTFRKGTSSLNSLSQIKNDVVELHNFYNNNFSKSISDINLVSDKSISLNFKLYQNYPNPFNPTTTIKYSIPQTTVIPNLFRDLKNENFVVKDINVKLIIYDVLGREVATLVNEKQSPGSYSTMFNAGNLSSGLYFYKLTTGEFSQTKKMLLLK